MSDSNALTPRVFLVRHGETEWAKLGRSTGTTEIELTPTGAAQVSSMAAVFVGVGKVLDPNRIQHIFVSPRKRAQQTFQLLLQFNFDIIDKKITYTEDVAEWDYGDYEGFTNLEIRLSRQERGLDQGREWDIWSDGCEGGESRHQVTERLDKLILQIKEIQKPYMRGEKPADVLLVSNPPHGSVAAEREAIQVAHGLILRCFVKRWLGLSINDSLKIMMEPAAITALSYKNNNINEPALHTGLALPVERAYRGEWKEDQRDS